jgi:hypothetical protein
MKQKCKDLLQKAVVDVAAVVAAADPKKATVFFAVTVVPGGLMSRYSIGSFINHIENAYEIIAWKNTASTTWWE